MSPDGQTESARRNRKRFQFTLAGVLLAVTVLCIGLAYVYSGNAIAALALMLLLPTGAVTLVRACAWPKPPRLQFTLTRMFGSVTIMCGGLVFVPAVFENGLAMVPAMVLFSAAGGTLLDGVAGGIAAGIFAIIFVSFVVLAIVCVGPF